MKTNRALKLIISVIFIITLAACTKPRPAPEETEAPTSPPGDVQPGSTEVMDKIYEFATQTANVLTQTAEPIPANQTPISADLSTPTLVPVPTQASQATPTVNIPPPTPGIPAAYTLQKGEFPFCIARRYNVNPQELLRINNLGSYWVYQPGITISIPQSGQPFPGNPALRPHPTTYAVRGNDTIYKIACYFGNVSPDAIAFANNLTPPYKLAPGQTLQIP